MTKLIDLKPTKKFLVINLLREAGFDVSDWENFKGKHVASNPKSYNWSFEQPGEMFAICLWYSGISETNGQITHSFRPSSRLLLSSEPGSANWKRRSSEMQDRVRRAYEQELPVRVIIVDGKQRNPDAKKPVASQVSARLLDPQPWAVKNYNLGTGEWLLIRGAKPFAAAVESSDSELAYFEGKSRWRFVIHRKREGELRRAKIAQALSRGRLSCEVPNCGFDFEKKYGEVGKEYAQVHHKIPLSKAPPEGRKISISDLAVVCANCHAMIHRGGKCRPLEGLIKSKSL